MYVFVYKIPSREYNDISFDLLHLVGIDISFYQLSDLISHFFYFINPRASSLSLDSG